MIIKAECLRYKQIDKHYPSDPISLIIYLN